MGLCHIYIYICVYGSLCLPVSLGIHEILPNVDPSLVTLGTLVLLQETVLVVGEPIWVHHGIAIAIGNVLNRKRNRRDFPQLSHITNRNRCDFKAQRFEIAECRRNHNQNRL